MVFTRLIGDAGRCVRRFRGLVSEGVRGVFIPWVHGRVMELRGNRPNGNITADGASENANMSRNWVRTTWPITGTKYFPQRGVSLGGARSRPWARWMQL